MKAESYNRELVYATAMFMDVFNDIRITRNSGKVIKVKCLNGKRSRIFKSLENPDRTAIQPPLIIIQRSGIERDPERVADLNAYLLKMATGTIDYDYYPPNPINLTFTLSVITKTQGDMDRILSNFIPFSHQSFFVKTPNPKLSTEEIKHEVVWDGTIDEEDLSDIDFESAELQVATTTFTFKTWIWPGTGTGGGLAEQDGIIKKINVQPNLCSIGTQFLFWKNGVTNSTELCALSGFELDDATYYNDIYSLSHWYAIPSGTSFDDYEDHIISGRIDPLYYDSLPMSATISGYVRDLGLDLEEGDLFNLNGDEVYFIDNEGGIVIYSDNSSLTGTFSAECMPTISAV